MLLQPNDCHTWIRNFQLVACMHACNCEDKHRTTQWLPSSVKGLRVVAFLLRNRKQKKNAYMYNAENRERDETGANEWAKERDVESRNNVDIEHLCVDRLQSHKHLSLRPFPTLRLLSMWYERKESVRFERDLLHSDFNVCWFFYFSNKNRNESNRLARHIESKWERERERLEVIWSRTRFQCQSWWSTGRMPHTPLFSISHIQEAI